MNQNGDAVEDIKARLSIEDVVGDFVELKRAGRNLKGLSPFNPEKTPSFMVSPDKQIWYDFSANSGGDMFSFIMRIEGVDFKGALELLARKAGIDLDQYRKSSGGNSKLKERLYEMLELTTRYYQATLIKNPNALDYLIKKRGYKRETMEAFRFGYSPQSYEALYQFLTKKGYTKSEIQSAGLGVDRRGRFGDMFRGRIMIPLSDAQGRVVGFTARQLIDNPDAPKYINTPQTLLYDKGRQVFGLHLAKDAIRQADFAVAVEGNLDVVASWQAGVKNVVAIAGTALTNDHLKSIARFSNDLRLAFDTDRAGIAATERAIPMAQEQGLKLSIVDIPDGKDPDELVKKDPLLWQQAVANSTYVVDWLFAFKAKHHNVATALGKRQFSDELLAVIQRLSDPVEKEHYLKLLAKVTGVSVEAIQAKMSVTSQQKQQRRTRQTDDANLEVEGDSTEKQHQDRLLSLLVSHSLTRRVLEMTDEHLVFNEPEQQLIYEFVETNPHITIEQENIPEDLQSVAEYVKMLLFKAEVLYDTFDAGERLREAQDLVDLTQQNSKKRSVKQLTSQIKEAEEKGDEVLLAKLLDQLSATLKKER